MSTILVSGASGIVGYGILKSMRMHGQASTLIGTSIYADSVAQKFCDIFELAPPTGDPGYMAWLQKTIRAHRVDLVVPGIEIDVYKWIEHIQEIEESGAKILLNTPELIHSCKDKWTFYNRLRDANLFCAIESSLDDDFEAIAARFGLPFLLKPRRGFGSKGIVRIANAESFAAHKSSVGTVLMAQPIVGTDDEEFTTSAFCDGGGGICASMTLKRRLSKDGFTEKAEVVSTDEFNATIAELCSIFRPLGPTNFQFRRCAGGPKLLEINPRISSSTSIRAAFGYNESAMSVDFFLSHVKPTQPTIRPGRAVRYTEDHIIYDNSVYL
jgi:carbamoyl-phosphate synthase large subunit